MNVKNVVDAYNHLRANAKIVPHVYKGLPYHEMRALESVREANTQINTDLMSDFLVILNNELPTLPPEITSDIRCEYRDVLKNGKHYDQIGIIDTDIPDYMLHFVYIRQVMKDIYFDISQTPLRELFQLYVDNTLF